MRPNNSFYSRVGKRALDVVCSALGIVLLSPLFALVAVLVKVTSAGPVLFRQRRVGRKGELFEILKFRSMRVNAENEGPPITCSGDKRVTVIGAWLRRTKLDELPQLWNVLVGDMSLVGPRPEVPKYVALYSKEHRILLSVRPGITDPATIEYRHEEEILGMHADPEEFYIRNVLDQKLSVSVEYLSRFSFRYDLWLVLQTIWAVLYTRPRTTDSTLETDNLGAWD